MTSDQTIRVMLVDDSGVVRRMVSHILAAEPDLEVAAEAADGVEALERLGDADLELDLLVLDVEMPGLDGLGVLRQLNVSRPDLPVVMFSAQTERAADLTLEALALGARDFACKPRANERDAATAQVRSELIERIRVHGRPAVHEPPAPLPSASSEGSGAVGSVDTVEKADVAEAPEPETRPATPASAGPNTPAPATPTAEPRSPRPSSPTPAPPAGGAPRRPSREAIELVVIGSSTGGPVALARALGDMAPLPVPIVIVQHMPPLFTQRLAERLDSETPHTVREAQGGERPQAGEVWIAQGDRHLEVRRAQGQLELVVTQRPPENFCRPAVDVLFRTAAAVTGGATLAAVLTGMGDDGCEGAKSLVATGARLIAQDRETSVVWGMPGEIHRAGLPAEFLPIDQIGGAIQSRVISSIARAERAS